ncbi:AAA family ATPase [Dietzia lutea]|uniref:AAA family ATPase n=1 Tax=Dietzia lutea TaxID=546160 RepID=A0A2S1RBA6_9ACTN|nr:AAA family ATPase [Dietzia lutea]AWH93501.1 AAA family ATPase [Dietzia lutea]
MRNADDPITWNPQRIAVAGVSGSGKTTLCDHLAGVRTCARVEMDSLFHGPGWTPRESFLDDVREFVAGPRWVIELQYRQARPLVVSRADTLLWLDYPARVHMTRLVRRTVRRRLRREELWNGNTEPPLHTVFTDSDHILRWGWRTRHKLKPVVPTLEARFPDLTVVRLTSPRQSDRWVEALAELPLDD